MGARQPVRPGPARNFQATVADWAHRLANLEPVRTGPAMGAPPGEGGERRGPDLSMRVSHIKTQINAAWEETMQQTFLDEVTLMGVGGGGGGPRPAAAAEEGAAAAR